jgi:hypothetical protein
MHEGMDRCNWNTNLYATSDGVVKNTDNSLSGYEIILKLHTDLDI